MDVVPGVKRLTLIYNLGHKIITEKWYFCVIALLEVTTDSKCMILVANAFLNVMQASGREILFFFSMYISHDFSILFWAY